MLGIDIGSSSVKTALLDAEKGKIVASGQSPASEMPMESVKPGFAEQDPVMWWNEFLNAFARMKSQYTFDGSEIAAIGIAYQMHGLVCLDKQLKPLRNSIIWCDSRAVDIGNEAFDTLGADYCLANLLNSPGNFTASKLKWVQDNEPETYRKIFRMMLPGDYIALKLTGEAVTTVSGLSEGMLWDYREKKLASRLLEYYRIDSSLVCPTAPTFGIQGKVTDEAARATGLKAGTPVTYRAGDQPNNAYSLNVLKPGEVAATAGTSGVVYGITDKIEYDPASRVNTFAHVNHADNAPRLGILLCINGTGILNSWIRKNFFADAPYEEINRIAAGAPVGSEGLLCYPFGNGAERVLENRDLGATLQGLQFNIHNRGHVARAAQEGIVFALYYGISVMEGMGTKVDKVRAGHANMFLSDLFAEAFANTTGATLELYDTDGAAGAARAAGVGAGVFAGFDESFRGMEKKKIMEPSKEKMERYREVYDHWKRGLGKLL